MPLGWTVCLFPWKRCLKSQWDMLGLVVGNIKIQLADRAYARPDGGTSLTNPNLRHPLPGKLLLHGHLIRHVLNYFFPDWIVIIARYALSWLPVIPNFTDCSRCESILVVVILV